MPPGILDASTTSTSCPAFNAWYAAAKPMAPAPITTNFAIVPLIMINARKYCCTKLLVRQAHGVEIPRCVWQPFFGPSPVLVLAGHGEPLVEGDAVLIVACSGDAVEDCARRAGVFVRAEEHIRSIAVPAA